MSNSHQEKFITKLLIGVTIILVSVFLLFYTIYERPEKAAKEEDWYWWAFGFAALLTTGVILICSAYVHKVKSDLIRRQQQRMQQKTVSQD
jgi:preprotein translocase subunit YajC